VAAVVSKKEQAKFGILDQAWPMAVIARDLDG